MEIVGVVGNLKNEALSQPVRPEFYVPVAQTPAMLWPFLQRSLVLVMRGRALGATPGTILGHVLWRGLRPLLAGLVAGVALAILTSRVLESQLYNVQPTDPATITATGAVLMVVALIATYVLARRALRVAPAGALTE
jgi:hypothetical protein